MQKRSKREKQNKVKTKQLSTIIRSLTQITKPMRKAIILELMLSDEIIVVYSINKQ